jgi:hypothetical protein
MDCWSCGVAFTMTDDKTAQLAHVVSMCAPSTYIKHYTNASAQASGCVWGEAKSMNDSVGQDIDVSHLC